MIESEGMTTGEFTEAVHRHQDYVELQSKLDTYRKALEDIAETNCSLDICGCGRRKAMEALK